MQEQITMADAQEKVDKRDRLTALIKTDAFKEFFMDGYFRDEAMRLAQAITHPGMQDDIDQREIDGQFRAIGHVQNYILTIKQEGDRKEANIKEHLEEELERQIQEEKTLETDPITGEEYEVEGE